MGDFNERMERWRKLLEAAKPGGVSSRSIGLNNQSLPSTTKSVREPSALSAKGTREKSAKTQGKKTLLANRFFR